MIDKSTITPLRVLHVLTLSGNGGEYGGPVRVAREICKSLDPEKFSARIFTGALKDSIPTPAQGVDEAYAVVRPLIRSLPFSSLWSTSALKALWFNIRGAEIVHIHFARDLIPIVASIICKIQHKPYVTQTHGMVVSDIRRSTLLIDRFFALRALNSSRTNFVLSVKEISDIKPLNLTCPVVVLPNGITVPSELPNRTKRTSHKIVFCSRLQERKRPELFLDLAKYAYSKYPELNFEIYGPDGGELPSVQKRLQVEEELRGTLYLGAVAPNDVTRVLSEADLLILPSENEQFPMVVLEALSVGTPVLIMPSCALSRPISRSMPDLVANKEDLEGLIEAFEKIKKSDFLVEEREKVQAYCRENFGMDSIVKTVTSIYQKNSAA